MGAASTSSGVSKMKTCEKPSRFKPRIDRRNCDLLLADDVRPEVPVVPTTIPLLADGFRQVEDEGDRQAVILASEMHQWLAGLGLDVRGVNDGQSPTAEPLAGR